MADILELVDLDELRHQVRETYREVRRIPVVRNTPTISIPAARMPFAWATQLIR